MNNKYRAGFSQIDITPEYQTTLVGRYRPENSQGVQHRIYAQALIFQSTDDGFCLIAIDSLGLTIPLANEVRSRIANLLHTEISHVMLNFSHTHSAPEPTPHGVNGEQYFTFLAEQITLCVESAVKNLHPCKVGWTLSSAEIGANRRLGGSITDNRLGALMVAEADAEKPIALVVRIAAHNNILPSSNLNVSSDFIGVARDELQRHFDYPVMVLQGASGNIKAAGTNEVGEGDDATLLNVAGILVESVKNLRFELNEVTSLQMYSRELICISDTPSKEEADKFAEGNPWASEWVKTCSELRHLGIHSQSFPVEINFLYINEGCICGVPDEIFCELAIDASNRAHNPLLFLNGYTNGVMGYLPSREEWYKGGYEVIESYFGYYKYFGRVTAFRPETADRIVDLVVNEQSEILIT